MIDKMHRGPLLRCEVDGVFSNSVLLKQGYGSGDIDVQCCVREGYDHAYAMPDDVYLWLGDGEYVTAFGEFRRVGEDAAIRCFEENSPFRLAGSSISGMSNIVLFTDKQWAVFNNMKLLVIDRVTGRGVVADTPVETWKLVVAVSDDLIVCWRAKPENYTEGSIVSRCLYYESGDVVWVASIKRPSEWHSIDVGRFSLNTVLGDEVYVPLVVSVDGNCLYMMPSYSRYSMDYVWDMPYATHVLEFDRGNAASYDVSRRGHPVTHIGSLGNRIVAYLEHSSGNGSVSLAMRVRIQDVPRRIEGARKWVYDDDKERWMLVRIVLAVSTQGYIVRQSVDGVSSTVYERWDGGTSECGVDGVWRVSRKVLWCSTWDVDGEVVQVSISRSGGDDQWYIVNDSY